MDEICSFFTAQGFPLSYFPETDDARAMWQFDGGLSGIVIQIVPHSLNRPNEPLKVWVTVGGPSAVASLDPNLSDRDLSGYVDGWVTKFGDEFTEFVTKTKATWRAEYLAKSTAVEGQIFRDFSN